MSEEQSSPRAPAASAAPAPAPVSHQVPTGPLPEDDELEVDNVDSAYGSSLYSDSQSLTSSIAKGYFEHGRRYQSTKEDTVAFPSDDKQYESMGASHLVFLILESQQKNPLFRSPISEKAQHILDLGTGNGSWPIDVADRFTQITVHGVDLFPPPATWVPPNCILEVDDFTKPWTWKHQFDLVHTRGIGGSMSLQETEKLYRRAYHNLAPGGWFEHVEQEVAVRCDDDTMPDDSVLRDVGPALAKGAERAGTSTGQYGAMRELVEAAGFINVQEKTLKCPIGPWAKHPLYKDAGHALKVSLKEGIEGWCLWLFTTFGGGESLEPWSVEQTQIYVASCRAEIDKGYHIYQNARRVWAQKPYEADTKSAEEPILETVPSPKD